MKNSSKIFEILSQKIRYNVIKNLNIHQMSFSDILHSFKEISSNKLSFHLKKLIDSELVRKNETNNYELTEFGLKTFNFVEAYESDKTDYYQLSEMDQEDELDDAIKSQSIHVDYLTRPEGLPPCIKTFNNFIGKNSDYMVKNIFLALPKPINSGEHPQKWIAKYYTIFNNLITDMKGREWLEDRLLKLAYGTRGLQDFGIMDASVSVPPLQSTFDHFSNLLLQRGKAGFFATTGMGKSRFLLYLASWWMRTFNTPVLFVDNPRDMTAVEWTSLYSIMSTNIPNTKENSRWLLIIDDVHLVSLETLGLIKKFISDAGRQSWSVLIAFTNSVIQQPPKNQPAYSDLILSINEIKSQLEPLESSSYLDLNKIWPEWRPFFSEWVKWITLDILIDLVPWTERMLVNQTLESFESPWSIVVSIGFLKASLDKLKRNVTENIFPLVLYGLCALIYLLRGEKNLRQSELLLILEKSLSKDLSEIYSASDWEEEVIKLIIDWTNPLVRLIPPIKYRSSPKSPSLKKELEFSFYHQEWAREVCNILLNPQEPDIYYLLNPIFKSEFPTLNLLWSKLPHKNIEFRNNFLFWIRENTRFELTSTGEFILVQLNINQLELKEFDESTLTIDFDSFSQIQMLNYSFIKKVISNYRKIN